MSESLSAPGPSAGMQLGPRFKKRLPLSDINKWVFRAGIVRGVIYRLIPAAQSLPSIRRFPT